jgi:hypothetical protein
MNTDTGPFIGSEALAAGALTRYELRRHYRALMPNVYVEKRMCPSLRQRAHAAFLWSGRQGLVAGLVASALHGAKWVGDDAAVELIHANAKAPTAVITRNDLVHPHEVTTIDGLPVTTVARTAFDLGRRGDVGTAVARLDALARATRFSVDEVLDIAAQHRHARGLRQLDRALTLFDRGADSPKETWLRLMLIDEGFPRPQTQIPVPGLDGFPLYYLDMGWEHLKLAVEYDGVQHGGTLGYDIHRHDYIARAGWTVVRVAAGHRRPGIVARVHREWFRVSELTCH